MSQNFLISGSLAYDTIVLNCDDLDEAHQHWIKKELPEHYSVVEHFGGTGGNILYNAQGIFNSNAELLTSVGHDFDKYQEHFDDKGILLSYLKKHDDIATARVVVLTHQSGKQKSSFYPGASQRPINIGQENINKFHFFHLAPDSINATLSIGKELIANGKKYFLDPGQSINDLISIDQQNKDFQLLIKNSAGIFVNEHEAEILENHLKQKIETLFFDKTEFIVRTMGAKGVEVFFNGGKESHILDVCKPVDVVDPTGCGDAFRGGFLSAYANDKNLLECVQLGNVMGSFAIEKEG